jgi:hypothetical protein
MYINSLTRSQQGLTLCPAIAPVHAATGMPRFSLVLPHSHSRHRGIIQLTLCLERKDGSGQCICVKNRGHGDEHKDACALGPHSWPLGYIQCRDKKDGSLHCFCIKNRGHGSDHVDECFGGSHSWPQGFVQCGEKMKETVHCICDRMKGHSGDHEDACFPVGHTWSHDYVPPSQPVEPRKPVGECVALLSAVLRMGV